MFGTTMKDISCVQKIFRDVAAGKEARLVSVDKERNKWLESIGKKFRDSFNGAVLKRDGTKVCGRSGVIGFREEDDEGSVQAGDVAFEFMKLEEKVLNFPLQDGPKLTVETRTEAVRAGASILVHG